jgi:hypothetical protein
VKNLHQMYSAKPVQQQTVYSSALLNYPAVAYLPGTTLFQQSAVFYQTGSGYNIHSV